MNALRDGRGSERTVTNGSQTVTGAATYEGFGQTVATTGSSTDPYMFAAKSGYRNDGDCGLSLVGARYYDSQVGRFQSRDTQLDQHPYAYCNADPVNKLDPSGHMPRWLEVTLNVVEDAVVIIGVGVIGAITLPVSGPIAIIGAIGLGGAAGGMMGGINYYWDHQGSEWDNGRLETSVGRGAATGAIGGGCGAGSVFKGIAKWLAGIGE